jgi:hypothetical protein
MRKTLTLSINELSVAIAHFTNYDRISPSTGEMDYAIDGTPTDSGLAYEPKLIWTISALVSESQKETLSQIFATSDRLRRQQLNYQIAVDDSIQDLIEEQASRDAVDEVKAINGGVIYSAKFYARIFEPKFVKMGSGIYPFLVSFVLKELGKDGNQPSEEIIYSLDFSLERNSKYLIWL